MPIHIRKGASRKARKKNEAAKTQKSGSAQKRGTLREATEMVEHKYREEGEKASLKRKGTKGKGGRRLRTAKGTPRGGTKLEFKEPQKQKKPPQDEEDEDAVTAEAMQALNFQDEYNADAEPGDWEGGSSEDDEVEEYFEEGEEQETSDDDEVSSSSESVSGKERLAAMAEEGYGDNDDEESLWSSSSLSSEDEQGMRNRVGNVPMSWYEDESIWGYDVDGKPIGKEKKDHLLELLKKVDDPNRFREISDPSLPDHKYVLTDEDLAVIENITKNKYPNPNYDPHEEFPQSEPWKDGENPFYRDPTKASFTPSITQHYKLMKMVIQVQKSLRKTGTLPWVKRFKKTDPNKPYLLWGDNTEEISDRALKRRKWEIPVPKDPLPTHADSYRPPKEFLPTEQQLRTWEGTNPETRAPLPTQYDCLRHVPWYPRTMQERFRRCLDLFYATRAWRTKKPRQDVDSLLPDLPSPDDLRPFPCKLTFDYPGHTSAVRSLSTSPDGQYLATGCDDGRVRIFEVSTARLTYAHKFPSPVTAVEFNPNKTLNMIGVASGTTLYIIVPRPCGTEKQNEQTIDFLNMKLHLDESAADIKFHDEEELPEVTEEEMNEPPPEDVAEWKPGTEAELNRGVIVKCVHHAKINSITFHFRGDYIATVCPKDWKKRQIYVHILSRRKSINPFNKWKDFALGIKFGMKDSMLFIMSKYYVRQFNLITQSIVKKYVCGANQLTSMDVYPSSDHVIAGAIDRQWMWWDVDWGVKPWKRMTSHAAGVRGVAFHKHPSAYPLFATASDDGTVHVYHGRTYEDFTKQTMIVPLKILRGHKVTKATGVLACHFHPSLPWLFTAGGDGTVRLWTE